MDEPSPTPDTRPGEPRTDVPAPHSEPPDHDRPARATGQGDTPGASGVDHGRLKTWLFGGMLGLALVGMAVTMSFQARAWEVWALILLVYAAISIAWDWPRVSESRESHGAAIASQLLHWGGALAGLIVLVLFERTDVIGRESSSNVALLLLAVTCFLAGVHFERTFLVIGLLLGVMALAIGYLEQYLVWLVMLPLIVAAGWVWLRLRQREAGT